MSIRYSPILTGQGSYTFTTDNNIEYIAFFTTCPLDDNDGNMHKAYSFGFERSGTYDSEKFVYRFDEKIKHTIIFLIKEFFRLNGNDALIYFCFPDDDCARHRSIVFSRWYSEVSSHEIEHLIKRTISNKGTYYGGILVLKENPLRELIVEAVNVYADQLLGNKS